MEEINHVQDNAQIFKDEQKFRNFQFMLSQPFHEYLCYVLTMLLYEQQVAILNAYFVILPTNYRVKF